MENRNRIAIISDNITAKDLLIKKINLLRKGDALESYNYVNAFSSLSSSVPEMIILYADTCNSKYCFRRLSNHY